MIIALVVSVIVLACVCLWLWAITYDLNKEIEDLTLKTGNVVSSCQNRENIFRAKVNGLTEENLRIRQENRELKEELEMLKRESGSNWL